MDSPKEHKVNPLWGNVFEHLSNRKEDSRTTLLASIPVFTELSAKELKRVEKLLYDRVYESGEEVFLADQPGAAMFVILSGQVEIVLEQKNTNGTRVATLGKGDFFGELALLDNSPRSATARAMQKSDIVAIFRADLEKMVQNDPLVAAKIIKQLAIVIGSRLKETNQQLTHFKQQATRQDSVDIPSEQNMLSEESVQKV